MTRLAVAISIMAIFCGLLRYPSQLVDRSVMILTWCTIGVAALIAFERRSTPSLGFVVFSLIGTFVLSPEVSRMAIDLLLEMGISTGAIEYDAMQSMLASYSSLAFGVIGYVIGALVAIKPSKDVPVEKGDAGSEET